MHVYNEFGILLFFCVCRLYVEFIVPETAVFWHWSNS